MKLRPPRQLAFWLAVGGVSILADVVLNITADKLGERFPALGTLNDYRTRRNG